MLFTTTRMVGWDIRYGSITTDYIVLFGDQSDGGRCVVVGFIVVLFVNIQSPFGIYGGSSYEGIWVPFQFCIITFGGIRFIEGS